MNNNTRNHPTPNNITPINGHPAPNADVRLDGFSLPADPGLAPIDFTDLADAEAGDLGLTFPPEGPLDAGEAHASEVSSLAASLDSSPLSGTPQPLATPIVPPAGELLPSAAFVTPAGIAYYHRLAEAPRLDLDFIQAEARAGGADGEQRVTAHHHHLFQMARGGLAQTLQQKRASLCENLQFLGDDIGRTRRILGGTRPSDEIPGATPSLNWTTPERFGVALLLALALSGVVMDFISWATILEASDPQFYHSPILAFLFGAIPVALPTSIKILLDGAHDGEGRGRKLRWAAWIGAAFCLVTIVCFSLGHDSPVAPGHVTFGSLAGSDENGTAPAQWLLQKSASAFVMVATAIFSAICCHLVLGMFQRRRRAARVENPQYTATSRQLAKLQFIAHEERETLGAVTGKLDELASEEAALVGSAVNYYRELRKEFTQSEHRVAELLQRAGGTPKPSTGRSLRKGAQALALAFAALLSLTLGGCGRAPGGVSGHAAPSPQVPAAVAAHIVLGLSPQMNKSECARVWDGAGTLVLQDLPPGGTFEAWDALELTRICSLTLPADAFYQDNPKARQKLAAPAMAALRSWLARSVPSDVTSPRILDPQFLNLVAHQIHRPGEAMAILLAGSALYEHPRDPRWTIPAGAVFNDGHFAASPEITPWSVAGSEEAMSGVSVHQAFLREDFQSEAQREGLTRFLSAYLKQQHGSLATFSRDVTVAFDNLRRGVTRPILDPVFRPQENKPGFRLLDLQPPATVAVALPTTISAPPTPIVSLTPMEQIIGQIPEAERRTTLPPSSCIVPHLELSFRWSVPGIDVDAYCRHHPGSPELFYGRLAAPDCGGRFWKDWQNAPSGVAGVNGFKIISFDQPTDLRRVECWVNLYRGHSPGGLDVTVQIVLADRHHYSGLVHLPASDGNRGANSPSRAHDPHWASVDILKIVGPARATINH